MPIFEYKCQDCNTQFDVLVKSSSSQKEIVCDSCGSTNVKKLLSTFSPSVTHIAKTYDGCADGSCGLPAAPSSPCASGMCGLN